jgi:deoxyribodipyrimidine photolyase-related protein
MPNKTLLILLGNQLFPIEEIQQANCGSIFLAEDLGLCSYEKHHKLKILMFLAAMREKRDELLAADCMVEYLDIEHETFGQTYEEKLATCVAENDITSLKVFEIEDKDFETRIHNFAQQQNLPLTVLPSPMFLLDREEFLRFTGKSKVLRMGNFYKEVRKKLDLLMDEDQKPLGGKWSFDEDNRKKIPKGLTLPDSYKPVYISVCRTVKTHH